jgi:hypothetical protein
MMRLGARIEEDLMRVKVHSARPIHSSNKIMGRTNEVAEMSVNLHGRSVLTLDDFTPVDIRFLLRLAADLKAAKQGGYEVPRLARKNIPYFREGFDPYPLGLRGCRLPPRRACNLYRPVRQPYRPQGIHEGYGPGTWAPL